MRRVPPLALILLACVLALAGCGGAETASVQVGVSDASGQPLAEAQVWVNGADQRVTTDATGNATLKGLKAGVYQVEAGVDGYFRQRVSVTVESKGDPTPVSISLLYAPPLGTFVYQPKSTKWLALSITSYSPFQAVLNTYEWGCWGPGWNHPDREQVQLDTSSNQLSFGSGSTIPIVGPRQLGSDWEESTDERSGLPDISSNAEPYGACNGSSAAWDNTNGG